MTDQPTKAEETTGAAIINGSFGQPGSVPPDKVAKEEALGAEPTTQEETIVADTAVQGAEPDED